MTEDVRLIEDKEMGQKCSAIHGDNGYLQVCISKGNVDGQLISSQESSEAVDVLTHVS